MRPIDVEVITYAPTVFAHCQHCELTFGHAGLRERFGARLRIKVVDVASIQGVWRSFRHRLRRYPAVIVQGERRYIGAEGLDDALRVIERYVTAPSN